MKSTITALVAVCGALSLSACATQQPCPELAPTAQTPASSAEDSSAEEQAHQAEPIVLNFADAPRRVAPNEEVSIVWLAQGNNAYLGELNLAPETVVPPHQHDSEEYLFIIEGGGVLTIDGQEHELTPGTAVLIPAATQHSYVNGDHHTIAFQIFADPQGAQRYLEWTEIDEPLPTEQGE